MTKVLWISAAPGGLCRDFGDEVADSVADEIAELHAEGPAVVAGVCLDLARRNSISFWIVRTLSANSKASSSITS